MTLKHKNLKLYGIVLFAFFNIQLLCSQVLHQWDDGPLKWSDFAGRTLRDTLSDFSFNPEIDFYTYNDQLLFNPRLKTNLFLNRNITWIKDQFKDRETLYFFQTYYDLAELYRRIMEQRMKTVPLFRNLFDQNSYQVKLEKIYDYTMDEFEHQLEALYMETNTGGDVSKLDQWSKEITYRLDTVVIPKTIAKNNSWGMEILMGPSKSVSDLENVFRPGFNFDFSIYYFYKSYSLLAGVELISNDTKRDEYFDQDLPKGTNISLTYFNMEAGYTFMDNSLVRVTPFTGFYLGAVYLPTGIRDDNGYDSYSRFIGNYQFGITLDLKLLSENRRKDPIYHGSYFGIRFKTKYLPVSFEDYSGAKLNFSVGVIVQGRGIEYKRIQ